MRYINLLTNLESIELRHIYIIADMSSSGDKTRPGFTWEETEVAALDRHGWRRSVAQCVQLDTGWIKVKVMVMVYAGTVFYEIIFQHNNNVPTIMAVSVASLRTFFVYRTVDESVTDLFAATFAVCRFAQVKRNLWTLLLGLYRIYFFQSSRSRILPNLEWQIQPEPDFQIDCHFTNLMCKTLRAYYEWCEFLIIFVQQLPLRLS